MDLVAKGTIAGFVEYFLKVGDRDVFVLLRSQFSNPA